MQLGLELKLMNQMHCELHLKQDGRLFFSLASFTHAFSEQDICSRIQ